MRNSAVCHGLGFWVLLLDFAAPWLTAGHTNISGEGVTESTVGNDIM